MSEQSVEEAKSKWASFIGKVLGLAEEEKVLALNIAVAALEPQKQEDGTEVSVAQVHGNVFLPTVDSASLLYGLRDQFRAIFEQSSQKSIEVALRTAEENAKKQEVEEKAE